MMVNEGPANRETCEPKLEMKKWSMHKRNSNPGKDLNAKALGMKQLLGAFQPLHQFKLSHQLIKHAYNEQISNKQQ